MKPLLFAGALFAGCALAGTGCGPKPETPAETPEAAAVKGPATEAPRFNLKGFNVILLKDGRSYFYYDSLFRPARPGDEFRTENLNDSFLHQADLAGIRARLRQATTGRTDTLDTWLIVEGQHQPLVNKGLQEVFLPLNITNIGAGQLAPELTELIKKQP